MPKESLRSILEKEIREKGYLSTYDMEAICHLNNYKVSNAERRLRESPNVEPVKNKKGAITGYNWIEYLPMPEDMKNIGHVGLNFNYKVHLILYEILNYLISKYQN